MSRRPSPRPGGRDGTQDSESAARGAAGGAARSGPAGFETGSAQGRQVLRRVGARRELIVTERETIAEIVRKALEAGQTVEIDGLGTFQASAQGYEFLPQTRPTVFIAYVAEDLAPGAAAMRGAAGRWVLPVARQRQAAAGAELAARHRTGHRSFRRLRGVLFAAIGFEARASFRASCATPSIARASGPWSKAWKRSS